LLANNFSLSVSHPKKKLKTAPVDWQFKVDLTKDDDDATAWQSYGAHDSGRLEAAARTRDEEFELNSTYSVSFADMIQFRVDDHDRQRPIRRVDCDSGRVALTVDELPSAGWSVPARSSLWQWESDSGFETYADADQALLEELSKSEVKACETDAFSFADTPYRIDFGSMTQTNLDSGTVRSIRRVTVEGGGDDDDDEERGSDAGGVDGGGGDDDDDDDGDDGDGGDGGDDGDDGDGGDDEESGGPWTLKQEVALIDKIDALAAGAPKSINDVKLGLWKAPEVLADGEPFSVESFDLSSIENAAHRRRRVVLGDAFKRRPLFLSEILRAAGGSRRSLKEALEGIRHGSLIDVSGYRGCGAVLAFRLHDDWLLCKRHG
jgi:hypothetical protein